MRGRRPGHLVVARVIRGDSRHSRASLVGFRVFGVFRGYQPVRGPLRATAPTFQRMLRGQGLLNCAVSGVRCFRSLRACGTGLGSGINHLRNCSTALGHCFPREGHCFTRRAHCFTRRPDCLRRRGDCLTAVRHCFPRQPDCFTRRGDCLHGRPDCFNRRAHCLSRQLNCFVGRAHCFVVRARCFDVRGRCSARRFVAGSSDRRPDRLTTGLRPPDQWLHRAIVLRGRGARHRPRARPKGSWLES